MFVFSLLISIENNEPLNVINIVLNHVDIGKENSALLTNTGRKWDMDSTQTDKSAALDEILRSIFAAAVQNVKHLLISHDIRRVTFIVKIGPSSNEYTRFFSFRERLGYEEDSLYRHVEPGLAFQLELFKLSNYNIKVVPTGYVYYSYYIYYNYYIYYILYLLFLLLLILLIVHFDYILRNLGQHLYFAVGKTEPSDRRFFLRSIIRSPDVAVRPPVDFFFMEGER